VKHRVRITQVYKTFRTTVVEVEADDIDRAIEMLEDGPLTGPSFDDPRWTETWELTNEEVEAAK